MKWFSFSECRPLENTFNVVWGPRNYQIAEYVGNGVWKGAFDTNYWDLHGFTHWSPLTCPIDEQEPAN